MCVDRIVQERSSWIRSDMDQQGSGVADEDLVVDVPISRLREVCDPFLTPPWGCLPFSIEDVMQAVAQKRFAQHPYDFGRDDLTDAEREEWALDRDYHIERIAFFVANPQEACDVGDIDVGMPELGAAAGWLVCDGNHRLAAKIVLNEPFMRFSISGSLSHAEKVLGIDLAVAGYEEGDEESTCSSSRRCGP